MRRDRSPCHAVFGPRHPAERAARVEMHTLDRRLTAVVTVLCQRTVMVDDKAMRRFPPC